MRHRSSYPPMELNHFPSSFIKTKLSLVIKIKSETKFILMQLQKRLTTLGIITSKYWDSTFKKQFDRKSMFVCFSKVRCNSVMTQVPFI